MIDHLKEFADFEATMAKESSPRVQVVALVRRYAVDRQMDFSLVWRMAYLRLEARTTYRVPEVKNRLQSVEEAGQMEALLDVMKEMENER